MQHSHTSSARRHACAIAMAALAALLASATLDEAGAGWRGGGAAVGGRHPAGGHPADGGYKGGPRGEGARGGDWRRPRADWGYRAPPRYIDMTDDDDDVRFDRPRRSRTVRPPAPQPVVKAVRTVRKPAVVARPAPPTKPARGPKRIDTASSAFVAGEVLCEIAGDVPAATVEQIWRGYGLQRLSFQRVGLAQSTLYRVAINDRRSVASVVQTLQADPRIASAQPNYIFRLQDNRAAGLSGAQYASSKLHLPESHALAKGDGVIVAVIDSGVDIAHPELVGAVAANINALASDARVDAHGTAIAGVIAAHANLLGVAPAAKVLAIRAFAGDKASAGAIGATSDIVRAVSIAADSGARIVNMSFAGPEDPLLHRVIEAAHARGVMFVAAAGNAGPRAAPAFPAADPNVIAVTATDAVDALLPSANRGDYVGVAAPGVDILVATPGVGYSLSSGTSVAAAHVSGVLALMLQRDPELTPSDARRMLVDSARDLGPAGRDDQFGAGLVDAARALGETLRASERRDAAKKDGAPIQGKLATVSPLE